MAAAGDGETGFQPVAAGGAAEEMPKRRRWERRAQVDRERKASPLMPPPGVQCPITQEGAKRDWDQAAAFLGTFVPEVLDDVREYVD